MLISKQYLSAVYPLWPALYMHTWLSKTNNSEVRATVAIAVFLIPLLLPFLNS